MTSTLSDSEDENEEETTNKAFTGMCETNNDTSNKDFLDEELAEGHKHFTYKWNNLVK
jgi:hypothetical protein